MPRVRPLIAAALLVTGSALVSAGPAAASNCAGADAEAEALSQTHLESTITCLINEERAKAGLRTVRSSGSLRQAALGHSQDMVQNGYFEHTSPSGQTFTDRITKSGYMRGARRWLVGENLVWGSGSQSTPRAMVDGWMGSPPHRANLLRGRFREVGVAAVRGTPVNASDDGGVTVSSEYGFRTGKRFRALHRRR
ncbi:MAG: CAP domain-containing protein [Solirubrobacterales bacterium]